MSRPKNMQELECLLIGNDAWDDYDGTPGFIPAECIVRTSVSYEHACNRIDDAFAFSSMKKAIDNKIAYRVIPRICDQHEGWVHLAVAYDEYGYLIAIRI